MVGGAASTGLTGLTTGLTVTWEPFTGDGWGATLEAGLDSAFTADLALGATFGLVLTGRKATGGAGAGATAGAGGAGAARGAGAAGGWDASKSISIWVT